MMEEEKALGSHEEVVNTATESHISEKEYHQEDYADYSKEQLLHLLEKYKGKKLSDEEVEQASALLKAIKPRFDEIIAHSKEEALQKFLAEGGEEADFSYKQDTVEMQFSQIASSIRKQRAELQEQIENSLKKNLDKKNEIIDKLRALVSAEEENEQTNKLVRELQQEWKKIGDVPRNQARELWANYNALMEMYYNRLSIYNELKDLDRKKNLEAKTEICEKAEKLIDLPSIKDAIKQLNELHEEFKHIGPVGSKEEQDAIWKRFKEASDAIYEKKKQLTEVFRTEMLNKLALKEALCQKVKPFETYRGEKIKHWQAKTQELLAIQKEWEEIGQVALDKAKEVTKEFWNSFKIFFKNKAEFFYKLDQAREANLQAKEELCKKAQELVANSSEENMEATAEELKKLQEQWKEIGAVPEKYKEEIFEKFRKILDEFFEQRRQKFAAKDKEEKENYEKKNALCERLKNYSAEDLASMDIETLIEQAIEEWKSIGFVPRKSIEKIKERFYKSLKSLAQKATHLSQEELNMLDLSIELKWAELLGKGGSKDLAKREQQLRKKISELEEEVATLNNNLGFFESTNKKADSFKDSFQEKIKQVEAQLKNLKNQLKIIRRM
ncbi:MAG: DUF349 domain-containing protein [Raineya sp.]